MPSAPPERHRPLRIATISGGANFLETLAGALIDGRLCATPPLGEDPIALSEAQIFLPTRRAVREMERVMTRRLGGAALLPRILPLGDEDEDSEAFDPQGWDADALPPDPIGETERRLVFTRMIQKWALEVGRAIVPHTPSDPLLIPASAADAAALAAELSRLVDSFETENVDWARLADLVPEEHDQAWDIIRQFLVVAAQWWPAYLAERGLTGPAAWRNRQIARLGERLARERPGTPFVIAGSTGSNPATADLMGVIAGLDHGAVVLPGLAVDGFDNGDWEAVGAPGARAWTHPQHGLFRLLRRLKVERGEVMELARDLTAPPTRTALATDALRPAATTDRWASRRHICADLREALAGVTLVEAANEREEALAIAIALREALEDPAATAALVTPDRNLARRVTAELARWGIAADDTGGQPLAGTPAGVLARLIASAAASRLAPEDLRALVHHCDAHFGFDPEAARRAATTLELAVLRGPRPPQNAAGLRTALELARARTSGRHTHPRLKALSEENWDEAALLIERVAEAFAPLIALDGERAGLAALAEAHCFAHHAIAGKEAVFGSAELRDLFDEIDQAGDAGVTMALGEYPAFFSVVAGWCVARPPRPAGERLRVLGTLEARLLSFDRIVLGGLVEGHWPPDVRNDPWLSRAMRADLGLPPPEWRIGLSAHDFEQKLGQREVVITRALKVGGAPSVASRWLQRLEAVAGAQWQEVRARGARIAGLAALLDEPQTRETISEPRPCPPRELRPQRLSVTEIETLFRDPYAIYARHVLGLHPLAGVGEEPAAAERGTIIHEALARFVAQSVDPAAPDARDRLIAIGREVFAPHMAYPDVQALWWPRFERVADWFVKWERGRHGHVIESHVEGHGAFSWETVAGRTFTLSGTADRVDRLADGSLSVVDYKTGTPPTADQARAQFSPQLPLEAAMLAAGAFRGMGSGHVSDLRYVRISGTNPPGEDFPLEFKDMDVSEIAAQSLARLKSLIDRFEDPAQPYRALMHPKFRRRPNGDYDHLARIAEWALSLDGGDEN